MIIIAGVTDFWVREPFIGIIYVDKYFAYPAVTCVNIFCDWRFVLGHNVPVRAGTDLWETKRLVLIASSGKTLI